MTRAPGQALDGQAVANYIAKYATKTLAPGLPSQRLATTATSSTCAARPTTGG